jgi:hypothetical protein
LFYEEEEEEEEDDVVGMVYPADVGLQCFLFFRTRRRRRWGWNL